MKAIFNPKLHKRGIIVSAAIFLTMFFGIYKTASAQVAAGGYIQAVDEVTEGGGAVKKSATAKSQSKSYTPKTAVSKKQPTIKSATTATPAPSINKTTPKVTSQNKKSDGFIVGDKYTFLNSEIAKPVQPVYRQSAKQAGASGLVQVEILVDENGNVLEAKARTGNKLLWEEAEKAALATKFNKPYLYNKPARAAGFIVYRFGKSDEPEDDDGDF